MTDYADLIARLLRISDFVYGDDLENAVEALKAQAKRIAALEYDATYHESNDGVMMRDIEYYRARIAELEADRCASCRAIAALEKKKNDDA